ncbi:alpha-xenorhabdolysin family binary toxin subunit B [Pseudomonas parafulva]|uniref:alpha-xenorhabdolysin family binary toxin subunit B n=1 Tax=Pseudomonas parafulva TaxID=157782 RepID=UPI000733CB4B|nr:alpha-xenorhabdolysin family binary toxin subunit B [Pseudomonas parafulva]KTS95158.1 hypothetical protein NS212_15445 [Pseudomonas parafulva]
MDIMTLDAALPDFNQMQRLQDAMFERIDQWSGHVLPAVAQQVEDLRILVLFVERGCKKSWIGAITLLEDRTFTPAEQNHERASRLGSLLDRLDQHYAEFARLTKRLEVFSLAAVSDAVPALEARTVALQMQSETALARLQRLQEQNDTIVQAIKVFDRPSITQAFKGLIPSAEEVDLVMDTVKDPKVNADLVKAVIAKLNTYADMIEASKTASDLVTAHAQTEARLKEARDDHKRLQSVLQAAQVEQRAILELSGLASDKQQWQDELGKVEREWTAHRKGLTTTMGSEAATVALMDLYNYLKAVQRACDYA